MACTNDCEDLPCPNEGGGTLTPTCGCSQDCGCSTSTPYYANPQSCQESHKQVLIQNQYVTGVTTSSSFVMPACQAEAVAIFPGLQLINIGVYLWNPTYGYLKVTEFDYQNSSIRLLNECQIGNIAAGTVIPSCTVFTVVDTPPQTLTPVQCEDFSPVSVGALVVCANGDMSILHPSGAGQIPVSTGHGDEVEFQVLDLPIDVCTVLSQNLVLLPLNPGPYTAFVIDSSIFDPVNAPVVSIPGYESYRITVENILSPTSIKLLFSPSVFGGATIPAGTSICVGDCCQQIDKTFIDYISDPCSWNLSARMGLAIGTVGAAASPAGVQTAGDAAILSNDASVTIENNFCKDMLIDIDYRYTFTYWPHGASPGDVAQLIVQPQFGYSTAAIGAAPVPICSSLQNLDAGLMDFNAPQQTYGFSFTYTKRLIVAAGWEARFKGLLQFTLLAPPLSTAGFELHYDNIGVALNYSTINV